jgi:hypothetical protein
MTPGIEYRVTCRGLNPRYFTGPTGRYQAHQFAAHRTHLQPTTWWRRVYERGTTSWLNLEHTQPENTP